MFEGCENLVGGQGTAYNDSNPKDKTYARIDGGTSNPGYLTLKTPQAIWCEGNATLYFINSAKEYVPNDTYDGQNVDAVWSGEAVTATSTNTYPLFNKALDKYCTKVVFDKSFATVRPTSCCGWFDEFKKLTAIEGLKYLNTSEVTTMGGMFNNCRLLKTLGLSSFNTAKVTDMAQLFKDCSSLETICVSDRWTTANVTESDDMFWTCTSLVGGQGTEYDANHTDKTYAHVDGGTSNPGYLTSDTMKSTPQAIWCEGNATLYFINSAKVYAKDDTYDGHPVTLVWSGTDVTATPTDYSPGFNNDAVFEDCTRVVFDESFASARPTSCYGWFDCCENLTAIEGLAYLNTSKVTTMGGMFYYCSSLETLDLSSFNTAKVTSMAEMFYNCSSLQTIFVSDSWTTANVTQSEDMFEGCTSLVGGQGTSFMSGEDIEEYAHVDGVGGPGYLTFGITLVDNDTQKPEGERNSDVILRYHGRTTNVTLTGRTLYKDGEWNTICLPFNVTLNGSPLAGATAKTLTAATMTGTTVTLTFGEPVETLTAGTPYIIKWEADTEQPTITNPVFEGVKLCEDISTETISMARGHVLFCGYYNAFDITPEDTHIYYMTAGSTLKYTGIDRTLNACRAFFEFSEAAAARQIVLDFGSDSTQGITSVGTQAADSHWFTVNGVRVENPVRKGLYIRNGKKTVVK
jgi:surface protein